MSSENKNAEKSVDGNISVNYLIYRRYFIHIVKVPVKEMEALSTTYEAFYSALVYPINVVDNRFERLDLEINPINHMSKQKFINC